MQSLGKKLYKKSQKNYSEAINCSFQKDQKMFLPDQWPSYYKKASGIEIWDLE